MAVVETLVSIVGLVVPALHGVRLLIEDVEQLRDAPKTIARLGSSARELQTELTRLQAIPSQEWESLGPIVAKSSSTTITACTDACKEFSSDLRRWTHNSSDGRLALTDRASVAFLRRNQIKTMSEQLLNCKLSIISMVNIATLYKEIRLGHVTEEIRETTKATQQGLIDALTISSDQRVVVQARVRELNLHRDDGDDETESSERTETLQQMENMCKALESTHTLLEELLAKAQEDVLKSAVGRPINNAVTFGSNNSGFQAHTINGNLSGMTFGRP